MDAKTTALLAKLYPAGIPPEKYATLAQEIDTLQRLAQADEGPRNLAERLMLPPTVEPKPDGVRRALPQGPYFSGPEPLPPCPRVPVDPKPTAEAPASTPGELDDAGGDEGESPEPRRTGRRGTDFERVRAALRREAHTVGQLSDALGLTRDVVTKLIGQVREDVQKCGDNFKEELKGTRVYYRVCRKHRPTLATEEQLLRLVEELKTPTRLVDLALVLRVHETVLRDWIKQAEGQGFVFKKEYRNNPYGRGAHHVFWSIESAPAKEGGRS